MRFKIYCEAQGFDPSDDSPLLWLAREGFRATLLPGWEEVVLPDGSSYFADLWAGESSWEPPLDGTFRDLYALLQSHEKPTRSEAKRLISKFEDELIFSIEQQLAGWSGPHIADAGSFWHCRDRGISVWD